MTPFIKDSIERAIATFVQGFAGVLLAAGVIDVSVLQAAGIAGGMAVLSFVKSIAASKVGSETPQTGIDTYSY